MRNIVGIVLASDNFHVPGTDLSCHQFHVVLRVDGTTERIRIRNQWGMPIRLAQFGPDAELDNIVNLFTVGARLTMTITDVPEEFRNERHGFDLIDKSVDARCIAAMIASRPMAMMAPLPGHLRLVVSDGESVE